MQESSPLLLPTRPTSTHDDETNQNNAQQRRYAGRKKKKKLTTLQDKVADATRLLKEQIAKANIITPQQSHGPSAFSLQEEQQSPESTSTGSRGRAPSPLSPTIDVTNYNETDSNSYATTTSLFTSSESNEHQERLPSPTNEVMDYMEYSSSPPMEAMYYYSPPHVSPPMGNDATTDNDSSPRAPSLGITENDFSSPMDEYFSPPVESMTTVVSPPPVQHSFTDFEEDKIDWGSDSEDEEEDVIGPKPNLPEPVDVLDMPSSSLNEPSPLISSRRAISPPPTPLAQEIEEVILRPVSESEVDRLHGELIANLNGNYDSSGSFREWHETLRVQTYGGDELLILPYTVVDF